MTAVTKMKQSNKSPHLFGLYKINGKSEGCKINCIMCSSFKCFIGVLIVIFGILTVACVSYDLTKQTYEPNYFNDSTIIIQNVNTINNNNPLLNKNNNNSKQQANVSYAAGDSIRNGYINPIRATKRQDDDIMSLYSSNEHPVEYSRHNYISKDMMSFPKDYEPKYSEEQEFLKQVMLPTPIPEAYTEIGFKETFRPTPGPFKYIMQGAKPTEFTLTKVKQKRRPTRVNDMYSAAPGHQHSPQNIQEIINYLQTNGNGGPIRMSETEGSNLQKYTTGLYRKRQNISQRSRKKVLTVQTQPENIATRFSLLDDPFFEYKPANPSDINLLAINSYRFATPLYMYGKLNNRDESKSTSKYKQSVSQHSQHVDLQHLQQIQQLQRLKQIQRLQRYKELELLKKQKKKNPLNFVVDIIQGQNSQETDNFEMDYTEYIPKNNLNVHPLNMKGLQKKPNKMVVHLNVVAGNNNNDVDNDDESKRRSAIVKPE